MEQHMDRDERRAGAWTGGLILLILLASVASFLVATRAWWLQPLASVQGVAIDEMFTAILVVTAIAFVAVHLFLALALFPALGLLILGVLGEVVWAHVYSAPPRTAQQVEVTGRQFFWYIRYPGPDGRFGRTDPRFVSPSNPLGIDPSDPAGKDDVVVVNELHVVDNRPVVVRVRSLDVIHSFFLPNFRVKQDAVPGRTIQIWFTPDRVGTYQIACAQLCGVGHYTMRGNITVEPTQAALDAWLAAQTRH